MRDAMRRTVSIFALMAFTGLAGLCLPAAAQPLDTSSLPRAAGAKELFASPATTMFTTPATVQQTTEATRKLLGAAGWQAYIMPHTAYSKSPDRSTTSFKKGSQLLSVYVSVARGQGNATSVQYGPLPPVKVDLPFPKDGTAIEYDPFRGILNCLTAEPLDKSLTFYRAALGELGWSLWSVKLGDKQPPDSGPGELTRNGAYAFYVQDGKEALRLTLRHEKDKLRVNIEPYRMKLLQEAHQERVDADRRARGLPVASAQPAPKPAAKPAPVQPKKSPAEEMTDMLNMAQQMLRMAEKDTAQRAKTAQRSAASDEVPALRADDSVPIPLPDTADGIDYQGDNARIGFDSRSSVGALASFYRAEMKKRGWQEQRSVINRANMVVLNFSRSKDRLTLTIMKFGDHANVSGTGSALAAQMKNAPPDAGQDSTQQATGNMPSLPMPAGAQDVTYDKDNGTLEFSSTTGVKALTDFYKAEMKRQGWKETSPAFQNRLIAIIRYAKGDDGIAITINASGDRTNVEATGSYLKSAAARNAPPSADDLKVEESGGLPVPKAHESAESEKTGMRRALRADVSLKLPTTLDFYRRELGKRQWKEKPGGVVADDHAEIAYASPEGPAVLKLGRRAGRTTVELTVKNPAEATKAGLLPRPGQAKLVFGNMLKTNAVIVVNKKKIKIGAGVGDKAPDGPRLDLPPGKYKVVLQLPGKPAQSEDMDVKGDETWGVIVGPGGLLPLQVY